ncbi:MAG: glycine C-acetyltransferase [Proteobacteria bacterium]|nr:glycine C-acetyltransferase [Pseudomonadota bacterium]
MFSSIRRHIQDQLNEIRSSGLQKDERAITTHQKSRVGIGEGREVLNLCANNYLGLADHPEVLEAAHAAIDRWGYGMSSVRFICGTQAVHKELEQRLSQFVGSEDTILYSSCFDANGGLFETLLGSEDAVISDELNHASIIDGIRLCKARRLRFKNCDMQDLEAQLVAAKDARYRLIATDGVFSMDGYVAKLAEICDLADRYDALVMVDDSHATGFMGKTGRGSHELRDVMGRVDIISSTLGKALGGASGGFVSGPREVVELLRQRSRPYLFSNTLCPIIGSVSIKVLDMLCASTALRDRLERNTMLFREGMTAQGFEVTAGEHPIVPIMLGDALVAQQMAARMLAKGVYVVGFSYPVVPKGKARIRVQLSALHTEQDLTMAIEKFAEVKRELGL